MILHALGGRFDSLYLDRPKRDIHITPDHKQCLLQGAFLYESGISNA